MLEEAEADFRASLAEVRGTLRVSSPVGAVRPGSLAPDAPRRAASPTACRDRTKMQGRHSRACSRTGACAGNPGRDAANGTDASTHTKLQMRRQQLES